jgi:hypothetical protein
VKAPDYKTFESQEHYTAHHQFVLPLDAHKELPEAIALLEAVQDVKGMSLGATYTLARYAQGLSVTMPSGWKVVMPFDMTTGVAVENPTTAQPKGNPARNGGRRKAG